MAVLIPFRTQSGEKSVPDQPEIRRRFAVIRTLIRGLTPAVVLIAGWRHRCGVPTGGFRARKAHSDRSIALEESGGLPDRRVPIIVHINIQFNSKVGHGKEQVRFKRFASVTIGIPEGQEPCRSAY